jgi:hypothetical protein
MKRSLMTLVEIPCMVSSHLPVCLGLPAFTGGCLLYPKLIV